MKRLICFCLCLIFLLCGCESQNTADFYYPRVEFQYGSQDGVIVAEERDITGHSSHLSFLISLYLMGPHSTELMSPFSGKAKLLSLEKNNNLMSITLTDTSFMSEAEYTLSCASLSMTCMKLTEVDCITINSGSRSLSLTSDVLTLYDNDTPNEPTEGETQ